MPPWLRTSILPRPILATCRAVVKTVSYYALSDKWRYVPCPESAPRLSYQYPPVCPTTRHPGNRRGDAFSTVIIACKASRLSTRLSPSYPHSYGSSKPLACQEFDRQNRPKIRLSSCQQQPRPGNERLTTLVSGAWTVQRISGQHRRGCTAVRAGPEPEAQRNEGLSQCAKPERLPAALALGRVPCRQRKPGPLPTLPHGQPAERILRVLMLGAAVARPHRRQLR